MGSDNVTDTALGFSDHPKAEQMTVLRPTPNKFFLFLSRLERESRVATEELRRCFEEMTKSGPLPLAAPVVELTGSPRLIPQWIFPRFRSRERLSRR